jgi:anthranilate phosphoribosyltransferase
MDEITLTGETTISEIRDDKVTTYQITPEQFGLKRAAMEELRGGDGNENAGITRAILKGEERGAKRDIVLLNAGATLYTGGIASSIDEGIKLAAEAIDSGKAYETLENLIRVSNE